MYLCCSMILRRILPVDWNATHVPLADYFRPLCDIKQKPTWTKKELIFKKPILILFSFKGKKAILFVIHLNSQLTLRCYVRVNFDQVPVISCRNQMRQATFKNLRGNTHLACNTKSLFIKTTVQHWNWACTDLKNRNNITRDSWLKCCVVFW